MDTYVHFFRNVDHLFLLPYRSEAAHPSQKVQDPENLFVFNFIRQPLYPPFLGWRDRLFSCSLPAGSGGGGRVPLGPPTLQGQAAPAPLLLLVGMRSPGSTSTTTLSTLGAPQQQHFGHIIRCYQRCGSVKFGLGSVTLTNGSGSESCYFRQ